MKKGEKPGEGKKSGEGNKGKSGKEGKTDNLVRIKVKDGENGSDGEGDKVLWKFIKNNNNFVKHLQKELKKRRNDGQGQGML